MKVSCLSIDLINADKPPASLAFLAGACEHVGAEYHCISLNATFLTQLSQDHYNRLYSELKLQNIQKFLDIIEPIIDDIIQSIDTFKSDIVLVSIFSFLQYTLAEFFLNKLKQRLPGTVVLAGGPGIVSRNKITNGKRLLDQRLIDFYCLGEGDELLVKFLQGERDLLGLNGPGQHESWVPQIDDLDSAYLVPSYKKIKTYGYTNLENKPNPVFSLSTSRGCVRSCSFCDVASTWKKFRFRSGHNIAQEILKHHQDIGAVNFTLVDSLINGSLKSFREFNRSMIKLKQDHSGLSNFSYNGMFIVRDSQAHPEEFFKEMSLAGCESLAIGVETGSDRLRFEMNKKFTNQDLDYHLEMCQKYGIRNALLTFVGYPTETREDFDCTLDMLHRYQKYLIDNTIIGINHSGVFGMLTDTPIYDHREELGIELVDNQSVVLNWHNKNNPSLTIKERVLRDLEFRQCAIQLRYPVPYSNRYIEYLKTISSEFVPTSD